MCALILFRDMLAVDAAVDTGCLVGQAENLGEFLLGGGDAAGVAAHQVVAKLAFDGLPGGILLCFLQEHEDQGHAHVFSVEGLAEVGGPRVIIHADADFVDPGQGVQDAHVLLGKLHLLGVQNVAVLQPGIGIRVREPLPLDAGHIQHV